jgi:hypothetical protein
VWLVIEDRHDRLSPAGQSLESRTVVEDSCSSTGPSPEGSRPACGTGPDATLALFLDTDYLEGRSCAPWVAVPGPIRGDPFDV